MANSKSVSRISSLDGRSAARRLALQFLYELDAQGDEAMGNLDAFLDEYASSAKANRLAHTLITQTWHSREMLDQIISTAAHNWQVSRLSMVDHGILRLAVYQLIKSPEIPPKVVINEAIDIAKEFSSARAPGFINGVLDSIYHHRLADLDESNE